KLNAEIPETNFSSLLERCLCQRRADTRNPLCRCRRYRVAIGEMHLVSQSCCHQRRCERPSSNTVPPLQEHRLLQAARVFRTAHWKNGRCAADARMASVRMAQFTTAPFAT